MAYALLFNGSGYVSIPAKTAGESSTATWTAIFDLEIPNTSNQTIYAAISTAFTDIFRITGVNTVAWRIGSGTTNNITISQNWPINTRFLLGIYRESGRNLVITIDGVEVYRANGVSFGGGGNAISVTSIGKASVGTFSGKMYEATIQGDNYLNPDQPDTTAWGDGTLTGIPSTNWELYGGGATAYTITAETVTDAHTSGDVTLIYTGSATAYSITCDTATDAHSVGDVTLTYAAAGTAAITSEPLKDNTNTLLANQALDYVAIYDNATGALVLRVTGISTNASGVFTVSDVALTSGVTYKLDWQVTSQSAARMPAKAAV